MSDPNTPSWLQEDTNEAAPAAAAAAPAATSSAGVASGLSTNTGPNAVNGSSTAANNNSETADDPDLPGVILTMRLANMGASIALIVSAVSQFRCDT